MSSLKFGVKLAGLQPQTVLALIVTNDCFRNFGEELVVTSCNDSRHGVNSLHYKGLAFDARSKGLVCDKKELLKELRTRLGPEFDVLLEDEGGENEHFHIEWDPD